MHKREGGITIFRGNFFVSVSKHRRGTLLCFRKFWYRKIFWLRRIYHHFPSKFFCLTEPKNFVGGPLCFRKLLLSKIFMHKKGGGYHYFPSNFFNLTVPKHIVVVPLCVSEKFWYRKFSYIRGGMILRRNNKVQNCR